MKRLYYEVWADAIDAANKNTQSYMSHKDKMFSLLVGFSMAQGFNLGFILFIIRYFIKFSISFNIFPISFLNSAFFGVIIFILPFLILNYFLVFYKKKYMKYMENRKVNTKGKALAFYLIISFGIFIIYIIVNKWVIN